ncbi:glycosyltransferase 87 family protein [Spirillospora sp. NPDC047279]|uniref:glycosyltransferase 87 family protein n=1 Tax=Spirillospora sp. NPDC047279 TaxID=3155478 RepID=UPI0033DD3A00
MPILFAVFAAVTALVSDLGPHVVWGLFAAPAYALSAVLRRTWVAGAGAIVLPLAVLVALERAQPEVAVVRRSGELLLSAGTPYLSPEQLAGATYESYNPYLPGMALFGVPGFDPRLLFGAFILVALGWKSPLLTSPVVALPLVVGGDDLPVIGLVCAAFALVLQGRVTPAGLVLGFAATLKATAWPALFVCLALVVARRAGAGRFCAWAGAVVTVGVAFPVAADPGGMFENVVAFPLGMAGVESPAGSPMPGHLLAGAGSYGHAAAVVSLGLAGAAMAVSLVVRPPADPRGAAYRLALGLTLAALLMPASRWGYLVYPAVLVFWARSHVHEKEPELCLAA